MGTLVPVLEHFSRRLLPVMPSPKQPAVAAAAGAASSSSFILSSSLLGLRRRAGEDLLRGQGRVGEGHDQGQRQQRGIESCDLAALGRLESMENVDSFDWGRPKRPGVPTHEDDAFNVNSQSWLQNYSGLGNGSGATSSRVLVLDGLGPSGPLVSRFGESLSGGSGPRRTLRGREVADFEREQQRQQQDEYGYLPYWHQQEAGIGGGLLDDAEGLDALESVMRELVLSSGSRGFSELRASVDSWFDSWHS